jgi:hypothetical protein
MDCLLCYVLIRRLLPCITRVQENTKYYPLHCLSCAYLAVRNMTNFVGNVLFMDLGTIPLMKTIKLWRLLTIMVILLTGVSFLRLKFIAWWSLILGKELRDTLIITLFSNLSIAVLIKGSIYIYGVFANSAVHWTVSTFRWYFLVSTISGYNKQNRGDKKDMYFLNFRVHRETLVFNSEANISSNFISNINRRQQHQTRPHSSR